MITYSVTQQLIPARAIEHDFWRLRTSQDEEVTVEFGDNLSSEEYGSGFPRSFHRSDPPVSGCYCKGLHVFKMVDEKKNNYSVLSFYFLFFYTYKGTEGILQIPMEST